MWVVAQVSCPEHKALECLAREGVTGFYPEQRVYRTNPKTQKEVCIESALYQGYVFLNWVRPNDGPKTHQCEKIARVLGEVPEGLIEMVRGLPPLEIGRKKKFKAGAKVKLLLGRLSEHILTVERVSQSGKVFVSLDMLGKRHVVQVQDELVEAYA